MLHNCLRLNRIPIDFQSKMYDLPTIFTVNYIIKIQSGCFTNKFKYKGNNEKKKILKTSLKKKNKATEDTKILREAMKNNVLS